ncbi:MAG: hypothetical protein ACLFSB_14190 [Chitinispirillaceae bacterium]
MSQSRYRNECTLCKKKANRNSALHRG